MSPLNIWDFFRVLALICILLFVVVVVVVVCSCYNFELNRSIGQFFSCATIAVSERSVWKKVLFRIKHGLLWQRFP